MFTDASGHYMPLTWLTLGLDYVVWGMNPVGYHLTSVAFHAANAALFFLVLAGLFRRSRPGGDVPPGRWAAAAGALFFAIHPLRVESVAWITERRDVVSLFFFLLCLLAWLRATDVAAGSPAHRKWLALSTVAFAASLLSKSTGFTLPLVLLLVDAWPLRRFGPGKTRAVLLEKIPYLVLMAGSVALTVHAQAVVGAVYAAGSYPFLRSVTLPGYRISFYVLKTLLPFSLCPMYPADSGFGPLHFLGLLAVLGITALVWLWRRKAPAAAVAWFSYALLISPFSGLVQGGALYIPADRYTYLPTLPLAALAAVAVLLAALRAPAAALAGAAALLLGLGVLTWQQCRIWKDSTSLWDATIGLNPGAFLPYNNRGTAKAERGDLAGAIRDYEASMALRPDWEKPWNNRGIARARMGDHAGAVLDFSRSLQIEPQQTNAYGYRALSRLRTGDLEGARADLDEALRRHPDPLYYLKRSTLLGMAGNLEGVIADCNAALALKPDYAEAWSSRGVARIQKGDAGGADDLRRALEVAPPGWPQRARIQELLRR